MLFRIFAAVAFLLLASCEHPKTPDAFPILTPSVAANPRINGAKVFGVRPGAPFLFQIAASGERPMKFSAENLPTGLSLDQDGGQISGSLAETGRHLVKLRAANARGVAERTLTIVVGEEIAFTPPMGWNSWNIWGGDVSQEKVLAAARLLVSSGLRDHGWTYVNVDDGWQGLRGGSFNAIQPNKKFPEMARLSAEIHSLGLKFGLYSTPWRTSFYGQIGSSADSADGKYEWIEDGEHTDFCKYRFPQDTSALAKSSWLKPLADWLHERRIQNITRRLRVFGQFPFAAQDAKQLGAWGVDYLKYDWVPIDVAHTAAMERELAGTGRDVVYSVANNTPFPLASEISRLANSWRTSGDVKDTWRDVSRTGFTRDRWAPFNRPGHYNDPDMLVLGTLGWGKKPRRTRLTSDEQYTHMSLWCLLAGPLLLGCDLEQLDPFTLGLLTNDEVLEINQDPLGKQATRVTRESDTEVFAKPMEDGSRAVGLFNRGAAQRSVKVDWSRLGLTGGQRVRDLWRQKDLGVFQNGFAAPVPGHGVLLIRVTPALP